MLGWKSIWSSYYLGLRSPAQFPSFFKPLHFDTTHSHQLLESRKAISNISPSCSLPTKCWNTFSQIYIEKNVYVCHQIHAKVNLDAEFWLIWRLRNKTLESLGESHKLKKHILRKVAKKTLLKIFIRTKCSCFKRATEWVTASSIIKLWGAPTRIHLFLCPTCYYNSSLSPDVLSISCVPLTLSGWTSSFMHSWLFPDMTLYRLREENILLYHQMLLRSTPSFSAGLCSPSYLFQFLW